MGARRWLAGGLLAVTGTAWAAGGPLHDEPEVRTFLAEVESRHGLDPEWLRATLREAKRLQPVLDAFSRPAEAKPWHAYREIFVTKERIRGGAAFIRDHREVLERARSRFGVPPEIVAAIVGIETFYGRYTGRYRVIDSLATLAFFAPRRREFFRGELEEYLLMLDEEDWRSVDQVGSYAGAIGVAQFIPSSYRAYAVDFDGDARRDLSGSVDDAIGSIGAYLARHGWRAGERVAIRVAASGAERADALAGEIRPQIPWRELEGAGLRVGDGGAAPDPETRLALIRLDGDAGPEYWAGFDNFYVITRYNRSKLYAMAVHQLAVEIRRASR